MSGPAAQAGPSSAAAASNAAIEDLLAPLSFEVDPHETLPARQRKGRKEKYIASGAHPGVQRILSTFPSGYALGEAAIKIIRLQLALRKMQREADRALVLNEEGADARQLQLLSPGRDEDSTHAAETVEAAKKLALRFGQSPESDAELLKEFKREHAAALRSRALTFWTRLPFSVMLQTLPSIDVESDEIDEWCVLRSASHGHRSRGQQTDLASTSRRIISNERFMRSLLQVSESEYRQAAATAAGVEAPGNGAMQAESEPMWKSWLVKLGSPAAETLFGKPDAKEGSYTVKRPEDLSGLCLLDRKRPDSIRLRTDDAFKTHWDSMTGGVLEGLDWNNILVAGGIVMSVLTGSFDEKGVESYRDSDIE